MAEQFEALEDSHIRFIGEQQLSFVCTGAEGLVNVSPKRYDFRGQRPTLLKCAEINTGEEVAAYWRKKNVLSLDGRGIGMLADPEE